MEIPMEIRLDNDGLLRKECPICEQQFKVFLEDDNAPEKEKYYCPICGIPSSPDSFFTKEQIEHAADLATNYMLEQLNNTFSGFSKRFSKSKSIRVNYKPIKKSDPRLIVETSDFEEVVLDCCKEHIFVFAPTTYKVIYCPKCGENNFPE